MSFSPVKERNIGHLGSESSSSSSQHSLGHHEGRTYRHSDKYSSGAAVLPDLLFNLMNGFTDNQRYELYSRGSRQGCVQFKVTDPETFTFEKSSSGSLDCAFMTPIFFKFVNTPSLKSVFALKNESVKQCIQAIFESILKGEQRCTAPLGEGAKVTCHYSSYYVSIDLISHEIPEYEQAFLKLKKFFDCLSFNEFYGQLH